MAVTAKDYLGLTNFAIRESAATQEELTSANFATTTDDLAKRFKNWVKDAWLELQLEREDWSWMQKRSTIIIRPRLYVEQYAGTTDVVAGYVFKGSNTEASASILTSGVKILSGTWVAGTFKGYLEFSDLDGVFKFNESLDIYQSDGTTSVVADTARVKGWGRYDLATEVSDLLSPILSSFFIQSTGGSSTQTNTATFDLKPLTFLEWDKFVKVCEGAPSTPGVPAVFTRCPDGTFDFWPRPNEEYVLHFTYQAEPQELAVYTDTLTGLQADYQDAIAWRAVMNYADWNRKSDVWLRANKRWQFYKRRLENRKMPVVRHSANRYHY
jgi:hypothetical protein